MIYANKTISSLFLIILFFLIINYFSFFSHKLPAQQKKNTIL